MVKNTKGGNKAKKQARKTTSVDPSLAKTRYSEDPDEIYACCSKLLGNGMCRVFCIDGVERLCVIRNKFRGRGRRGNVMEVGTWCLVGRRAFEQSKEGKLDKTDLLEVYGEIEKKQLVQKEVQYKEKWKLFSNMSIHQQDTGHDEEAVSFHRNTELPESDDDEDNEFESGDDEDKEIKSGNNYSYKAPDLGDEIEIDDI